MSNYSMKGVVSSVSDTQQRGNFEWRNLFLTTSKEVNGKEYNDVFEFQVSGKNLDTLSESCVGCDAEIFFNIRSREYNGKYYTNLAMWKMDYEPKQGQPGNYSKPKSAPTSTETSDDDLPF